MLLRSVEDWQGLAGSGTQRDEEGNLYSIKDDFIDGLVQEFFESFSERDAAQRPPNEFTMPQADRDKLHSVSPSA